MQCHWNIPLNKHHGDAGSKRLPPFCFKERKDSEVWIYPLAFCPHRVFLPSVSPGSLNGVMMLKPSGHKLSFFPRPSLPPRASPCSRIALVVWLADSPAPRLLTSPSRVSPPKPPSPSSWWLSPGCPVQRDAATLRPQPHLAGALGVLRTQTDVYSPSPDAR